MTTFQIDSSTKPITELHIQTEKTIDILEEIQQILPKTDSETKTGDTSLLDYQINKFHNYVEELRKLIDE